MADSRNPRRMLYILVILLAVAAVAVSFVKINFFGFSLSDRAAFFYQVDGNITLEPSGDEPVRISLAVPEPDAGWAFGLDPDSRTRFQLQEQDGFPRMVLTLPAPVETRRVSCRYRLVPAPQRELPPPFSAGRRRGNTGCGYGEDRCRRNSGPDRPGTQTACRRTGSGPAAPARRPVAG